MHWSQSTDPKYNKGWKYVLLAVCSISEMKSLHHNSKLSKLTNNVESEQVLLCSMERGCGQYVCGGRRHR